MATFILVGVSKHIVKLLSWPFNTTDPVICLSSFFSVISATVVYDWWFVESEMQNHAYRGTLATEGGF